MKEHDCHRPYWLKKRVVENTMSILNTERLLSNLNINTVCANALCPNLVECYAKKAAAFLIMGNNCTRNCTFCAISKGEPNPLDYDEPRRVAEAVLCLGLKYVVLTSVTRDDLLDGGAMHFAEVIKSIKGKNPHIIIEVLTPDFLGEKEAVAVVVGAKPNIYNHNMETVSRLYPIVRPQANYDQSLYVLKQCKICNPNIISKSGIMVGLGEDESEVITTMQDLRAVDCDILTIGQYLAPTSKHLPVKEFINPQLFEIYKKKAKDLGFRYVASAPFVRSSYNAADAIDKIKVNY